MAYAWWDDAYVNAYEVLSYSGKGQNKKYRAQAAIPWMEENKIYPII